jgi:hypothetical protein
MENLKKTGRAPFGVKEAKDIKNYQIPKTKSDFNYFLQQLFTIGKINVVQENEMWFDDEVEDEAE